MPRNAQWWDRRSSASPILRDVPTRYTPPRAGLLRDLGRFVLILIASVVVLGGMLACCSAPAHAQAIPREALQHRATLKREAQRVWGLDAPVATFAAQVHQESRWRVDARSPVGALGLAQFMPSTASWIGGVYPSLGERSPLNPTWALRGLVTYDKWLFDRIKADNECERMAFALSAYNGGLGWVYKRQQRSEQPGICMGATCAINPGVHPASQRENAHYPVVILRQHEQLYRAWGRGSCQ